MNKEQEIFVRKLLNDPRMNEKQKSLVIKLAKRENTLNFTKRSPIKMDGDRPCDPKEVAALMSLFDEGNACGCFLYPNAYKGNWNYQDFINNIRTNLKPALNKYAIPNNLRALLFKFIFGKYGSCKCWIDYNGEKNEECCDNAVIVRLCANSHPLLTDKTEILFNKFAKSIIVSKSDICEFVKNVQTMFSHLKKDFFVDYSDIQGENYYFYTNAFFFYTTLRHLLVHIALSSDKCKVALRHNVCEGNIIQYDLNIEYEKADRKGYVFDLKDIVDTMPKFLKGLCYVYYEAYFDNIINGETIGGRKITILGKEGEMHALKSDIKSDNGAKITFSFFRNM